MEKYDQKSNLKSNVIQISKKGGYLGIKFILLGIKIHLVRL